MQSIDLLLESAREFLHQVATFLPRLLMALVVVAVGWLLSKAARFAIEKGLRAVNFTVLTERAGTDNFLAQAGMRGDTTTVFGLVAFWLGILATLMIAFNGLGLTYITDLLGRVVLFPPNLLVSMLVGIFGAYCAHVVGSAVHANCVDPQLPDRDCLGTLPRTS